jgi:uncharacterized membrane protein
MGAESTGTRTGTGTRARSRGLLGGFFILAGLNHFVIPRAYERIVPPRLQHEARRLVRLSGAAEIAGGIGVLLPGMRRLSGLGLVAPLAAFHDLAADAAMFALEEL